MSGTTIDSGLTTDAGLLNTIAHPQGVNLLGAYAGAADTANKMYSVQDAQAQRAWGEALQASTNPQTGVVDYNRANALASQNPQAAMGMMRGLKGSSELTGATQTQGVERNKMMVNMMSSALQEPDDRLHDAVVRNTQQLVQMGVMTNADAQRSLIKLPNDPGQLRTMIEQHRMSLLPPGMQQQAIYGAPGSQTGPGGETVGTTQDVRTGRVGPSQPSGTGVQGGLPAAEYDKPFTYQDENGQPQTTTFREWARAKGIPLPQIIGPTDQSGVPSNLRNKNRPTSTTTAPAPAPGQPPGGATGPNPVEQEAKKRTADQSVTAFQSISDQAVQSRSRTAILGNMLADTTKFTTGPLASRIENLRAIANRFGITVNTEGLSAQESFNKLAAQLAQSQAAGAPSDARQTMAVAANPHQELSPAGVDLMIRQLQGNEDYLQARGKVADAHGDKTNVQRFEQETGSKLDPRAFQFARMTGPQRKAYVESLSDTDRKAVRSAYNWAHGQGLVGE